MCARPRSFRRRVRPRIWRRRPKTVGGLVLVVALVVTLRILYPGTSDVERYHNKTALCVYVVDGDTLDIAILDSNDLKTRIRLWGVDTPESSKSPGGAMYYGEEAGAFTASLVEAKAVRIVLVPEQTRDKYDRLLAYVYLADSDVMLNEELLIHGYAYADTRFKHPWRTRFVELEARARKTFAGLWRGITPEQMPEWKQRREADMASRARN